MARLLQNSNNPGTTTGSWGGLFTCCFGLPNNKSPDTISDTTVKNVDESKKGSTKSKAFADQPKSPSLIAGTTTGVRPSSMINDQAGRTRTLSTTSSGSNKQVIGNGVNKPPSAVGADKPPSGSGVGVEAIYKSWAGNGSNENIALAAKSKPMNQSPSESSTRSASGQRIPLRVVAAGNKGSYNNIPDEFDAPNFKEEEYTKDNQWKLNDAESSVGSMVQEKLTILNTHIKFSFQSSELKIDVKNVENAPVKESGGAAGYQLRIAIIGLKKKRWTSAIVPAPDPAFNESVTFKNLTPEEVSKVAIRYRLYACEKHRRQFVFAQSTIACTSINLQQGGDYPIVMKPEIGKSHVAHSEADSDDNSRITGSIFGGSSAGRSSIRSKLSHVSAKMHRRGSHQSDSGVSTAQIPPPQTRAEQVAKTSKADWPELQCGLMFDELTKRLSIRILRANRLKAPEATIGSPKTFASATLMSKTGEKIATLKTKSAKLRPSTEFGEEFAFDLSALSAHDVMVFFRVFHKHHVHKDVNIGWFAIGCNNTGEEERDHWNEMLSAQGQEITRWHILNEETQ